MVPVDVSLQDRLLKGVSRTFALTIPQLPQPLRPVVGNGYLLCRITDTIEDEPTLHLAEKQWLCAEFTAVVGGKADAGRFADRLGRQLSDSTSAAERSLVAATPDVVRLTHGFGPAQRAALERCVRVMGAGMVDFQRRRSAAGLADLQEMQRYCYVVAGVVGEMLTDLFCDYCPEMAARAPHLRQLAIRFGQGLQMTNILKDMWEDRQRDACWLPRSVFGAHGVELRALTPAAQPPGLAAAVDDLIAIAHAELAAALEYTLLIPPRERGMRNFCLWAIGMALLTLRRLHASPGFTAGQEVKISRRSVRATAVTCRLVAANDPLLRLLFRTLGKGLPRQPDSGRALATA